MTEKTPPQIILASGSAIRADMLRAAGIAITVQRAPVDEGAIKAAMLAEGATAAQIADALAELKAARVARSYPGALVLGADQVLVCEGQIFDKPRDLAEARAQLNHLRGRRHELISATVIFEGARPVWRATGRAHLDMRPFSDAFLEHYLASEGRDLLATVGCYRLETTGSQLFTRVEGDYFSVLGLPLLEVLGFLRSRGVGLA